MSLATTINPARGQLIDPHLPGLPREVARAARQVGKLFTAYAAAARAWREADKAARDAPYADKAAARRAAYSGTERPARTEPALRERLAEAELDVEYSRTQLIAALQKQVDALRDGGATAWDAALAETIADERDRVSGLLEELRVSIGRLREAEGVRAALGEFVRAGYDLRVLRMEVMGMDRWDRLTDRAQAEAEQAYSGGFGGEVVLDKRDPLSLWAALRAALVPPARAPVEPRRAADADDLAGEPSW